MGHETFADSGAARPRKRPPRVRIGLVGLFVLIMASLGTAGILAGIFPGSNAVLAPLLCPKDTTRSMVVKEVHQRAGKTSSTASLICQAPTGRLAQVSGVTLFFTMVGAVATILGTAAVLGIGARMLMRRSS